MRHVGRAWSGVLLTLLLTAVVAAALPERVFGQSPAPRYFTQTGHYLRGAFRSFWERSGSVQLYGYPITEEYTRRSDGKLVQYFERARFELRVVGNQAFVDLGLIGREFTAGRDFGRIGPFPPTSFQRYFPETGHSLRGSFKNFWEGRGGVSIFGFPISEEINEQLGDGRIYLVQYFERARFELRGNAVALGLLGSALAPCPLIGRLPANAAPSGPLQEPADARPCAQGGSGSSALSGFVYPSPARPGQVLGFSAQGYQPNETVSLWINLPGGSVRGLPYQAIASGDGGVLIGLRTLDTDPVGFYSLVGYGTSSRRQIVAPFQLRR